MDPPSSTRSRPRAWQGRGPRGRSEPGFSCTWHRPSLTWFSDILPRLRADREWGAPPMPPPAARQMGWRRGVNGPPPRAAFGWREWRRAPRALFDWREWGKPHARSDPIGLRQRAGADEALEPPAVGMHLAPILAGEIDHGEPGGRQPLIEPLAGFDVARGDQPPRRVMQPRIVSDHQQRAHRRRGLLHQRDDRFGAGVVEALLVNDLRGLRQRGGDALPGLPRALGRRHQDEVGGKRMTGHVSADHRGIVFAARIKAARVVAHAGFGLFRLGVSKQHQTHGSSIDVPAAEASVVDLKFLPLYQQARMGTSNPKPGVPQGFAKFGGGTLVS